MFVRGTDVRGCLRIVLIPPRYTLRSIKYVTLIYFLYVHDPNWKLFEPVSFSFYGHKTLFGAIPPQLYFYAIITFSKKKDNGGKNARRLKRFELS